MIPNKDYLGKYVTTSAASPKNVPIKITHVSHNFMWAGNRFDNGKEVRFEKDVITCVFTEESHPEKFL